MGDSPAVAPLTYSERQLDDAGLLSRKTRWRLRRQNPPQFPQTIACGGRKLYRAKDISEYIADPAAWVAANQKWPASKT